MLPFKRAQDHACVSNIGVSTLTCVTFKMDVVSVKQTFVRLLIMFYIIFGPLFYMYIFNMMNQIIRKT